MRRFFATSSLAVLLAVALCAAASTAAASPADAKIGDVRAALSARGVRVLQQPKTLGATVVRVAPYGTRMRVLEKRGTAWFRVQTLGANPVQGWVKMNQTVNVFALSGAGRSGATAATPTATATSRGLSSGVQSASARGFSQAPAPRLGTAASRNRSGVRAAGLSGKEEAAAARGFGDTHNQAHRASSAQIRTAYGQLDRIRRRVTPPARVQRFIRQGGLGR